jgi:hypothetical protein
MSISNLHRNSTEANKHTPKGFTDASNNSKLIRDERGESRYVDNINIGTFIDFADPTLPPPTTTNNHVYVLVGAGTVDADWGSAVENDLVRFFDNVPIAVTPTAGYFGYNLTENKYYRFTTEWIEFAIPPVWGSITGTLSDQTDLQSALDDKQDTLISGTNIKTLNGDSLLGTGNITIISENIATNNLSIPSTTTRTLTIPSDSILDLGANVRVRNNILELVSVTRGFLMNRVTTIQMNAIVGMSDNELVFNTDVKAIYRYDATLLQWVALSSGYGIIAVYSGSGSGVPTFFATLQSALETCKASGGYFTVKLYSNIIITSAIEIDYIGSGTGKAYQFRNLTIDFNGFSVTNAQANTSEGFDIKLSNTISVYQEITLINGAIIRTNGTGTHHAFKCNQAGRYGTVQMSKMFIYCQNSFGGAITLATNSTATGINKVCDLGGSTFVSQTGTALNVEDINVINFTAIAHGSTFSLTSSSAIMSRFSVENTSTGIALGVAGSVNCRYFTAFSNSGTCVNITNGTLSNFTANSVSGIALNVTTGTVTIDKFNANTGNNYAVYVLGGGIDISNGKARNNSTLDAVYIANFGSAQNIEGINLGSGVGILIGANQAHRNEASFCKGLSIGGIGGILSVPDASARIDVTNCFFSSALNTSGGHAVRISSSAGAILLANSHFKVLNSGANAVNATVATTIKSFGNTHNEVASTPINANVTITALASF